MLSSPSIHPASGGARFIRRWRHRRCSARDRHRQPGTGGWSLPRLVRAASLHRRDDVDQAGAIAAPFQHLGNDGFLADVAPDARWKRACHYDPIVARQHSRSPISAALWQWHGHVDLDRFPTLPRCYEQGSVQTTDVGGEPQSSTMPTGGMGPSIEEVSVQTASPSCVCTTARPRGRRTPSPPPGPNGTRIARLPR